MVALAGVGEGLWCAAGWGGWAFAGGDRGGVCVAGGLSLPRRARGLLWGVAGRLWGLSGAGWHGFRRALSAEEAFRGVWGAGRVLELAAVNGPGSVVFSGEPEALEGLLGELERGGVRARSEIPVGYAAHSEAGAGRGRGAAWGLVRVLSQSKGGVLVLLLGVTGGFWMVGCLMGATGICNLRERVDFGQAATRGGSWSVVLGI